jgi:hypothetical protein
MAERDARRLGLERYQCIAIAGVASRLLDALQIDDKDRVIGRPRHPLVVRKPALLERDAEAGVGPAPRTAVVTTTRSGPAPGGSATELSANAHGKSERVDSGRPRAPSYRH